MGHEPDGELKILEGPCPLWQENCCPVEDVFILVMLGLKFCLVCCCLVLYFEEFSFLV